MTYVDIDERKCVTIAEDSVLSHRPAVIPTDYKDRSIPYFIICIMEESVEGRV